MTQVETRNAMEINPRTIENPVERAALLFTQWMIDEVVDDKAAAAYAAKLLTSLASHGLVIHHLGTAPPDCYRVQRADLAGFDLVGYRLKDGRIRLGPDPTQGQIINDWPATACLGDGMHVYTLEGVKKNNHDGTPGIEWGIYV